MTNQSTIDKLIEMRLTSMADAFRNQFNNPEFKEVPFEDRFGMLVDIEYSNRKNNRLNIVPDKEHEGFFVPYLFIILDGSKTLDEVKAGLKEALEDYEYPVDIRVIEERPYFHFKTNRKELTEAILAENN